MLSKDIEGMDQKTLGLCDITVCRNAYGRQVDSFESLLEGDHTVFGKHAINAVLIRAPMIKRAGAGTETLLSHNNTPVLLRQGNLLACTFHPEITGDTRIHTYFVDKMVRENGKAYAA
jgi:5'-phosphate synthase pdxT subunit